MSTGLRQIIRILMGWRRQIFIGALLAGLIPLVLAVTLEMPHNEVLVGLSVLLMLALLGIFALFKTLQYSIRLSVGAHAQRLSRRMKNMKTSLAGRIESREKQLAEVKNKFKVREAQLLGLITAGRAREQGLARLIEEGNAREEKLLRLISEGATREDKLETQTMGEIVVLKERLAQTKRHLDDLQSNQSIEKAGGIL